MTICCFTVDCKADCFESAAVGLVSGDSCAGSDSSQVTRGDGSFGNEASPDNLPDTDFNSKWCPCVIDCAGT